MRAPRPCVGSALLFAAVSHVVAQSSPQLVDCGPTGAFPTAMPPRSVGNLSVSARARYVAFQTLQTFDPADTNGVPDVYVKDLRSGAIVRVSVDSSGVEGTAGSFRPHLSADGRFVVFESDATDLVPGDFNGERDVFLHDRDADENGVFDETAPGARLTVRVNVDAAGVEASGGGSVRASVSDDGRHVCFASSATNLVPADTNGGGDVFVRVRDLNGGSRTDADLPGNATTARVSVTSSGAQATQTGGGFVDAPSISADGRHVVFEASYSNLTVGDTNGTADVYAHDRDADADGLFDETGPNERRTVRVDVSTTGAQAANGGAGLTQQGVSGDGRYVVFVSYDSLVPGDGGLDADLHVFDRDGDGDGIFDEGPAGLDRPYLVGPATQLVADQGAAISPSGRYVAFRSADSFVVAGDTNALSDVFVFDRLTGAVVRVSVDAASNQQTGFTGAIAALDVADDGATAFATDAPNLYGALPGDVNGSADVYRNGIYPRMSAADATPSVGASTALLLAAPFDPGAYYLFAASGGYAPGVFAPGGAVLPLAVDAILSVSIAAPGLFLSGYLGALDAAGSAAGAIALPPTPGLVGLVVYVGFALFEATPPYAVLGVSNALKLVAAP
jgi:Tol biopolymer transport system component